VFLFSLLLAYFLVPPELRGRVIVIGIAGAILLRAVAIAAGLALIETVEAVVYVFGVLLVVVAYRAFRGADEQADPSANPVLRFVRRAVPTTADFRAAAGCSPAKGAASTARRSCWWSSRSSWPTSPSPWTRSRRRSRLPAIRW
jgi:predicted tellurium resistance membrane protein TerC